jgi:isoquinoline 1-oxidoreductase subunit alpha
MIEFQLNGESVRLDIEDDTPLLWALRENLKLTGTKYGCGIGQCGACTVHLGSAAVRACQTRIASVQGQAVTTIEGIGARGLHPVQQAWIESSVPQCGYCQSGQVMAAVALLERTPHPTDDDIRTAMNGNLCRCGCYNRIRAAIHRAAELIDGSGAKVAARTFDPSALLVGSVS